MKILLYTEAEKMFHISGLGKAIEHQKQALKKVGVEYTLNKDDYYDIIHINTYGPKSFALAKDAKRKGKKIVYHAHSTEEDFKNSFILSNQISPLFKKWIIKCYSLGDYIITPTPYSKKLLEGYGIKVPITAISNGIDLNFFVKKDTDNEVFRKKYNYKKSDKVIVGIGLYLERKGILDFVELAKEMPQYKFIWFGYTNLSVVPLKIKEAVMTKLDNLVFAGYVEQDMIRCALSAANLYIFPTLEETEGIPIIEASAMKIDSIIRDIGVFDGWLTDGVNVYKAKDKEEFKEKIIKILEHKLPSLKEEAYKVALSKDLNIVGKELKTIYEEVLKS